MEDLRTEKADAVPLASSPLLQQLLQHASPEQLSSDMQYLLDTAAEGSRAQDHVTAFMATHLAEALRPLARSGAPSRSMQTKAALAESTAERPRVGGTGAASGLGGPQEGGGVAGGQDGADWWYPQLRSMMANLDNKKIPLEQRLVSMEPLMAAAELKGAGVAAEGTSRVAFPVDSIKLLMSNQKPDNFLQVIHQLTNRLWYV